MLELIGWTGSMLFCFCALPQAVKIWQTHSTNDLSWIFLIMWLFGEILTAGYVLIKNIQIGDFQYPLLVNYALNFLILCYLIYGKVKYSTKVEVK